MPSEKHVRPVEKNDPDQRAHERRNQSDDISKALEGSARSAGRNMGETEEFLRKSRAGRGLSDREGC